VHSSGKFFSLLTQMWDNIFSRPDPEHNYLDRDFFTGHQSGDGSSDHAVSNASGYMRFPSSLIYISNAVFLIQFKISQHTCTAYFQKSSTLGKF